MKAEEIGSARMVLVIVLALVGLMLAGGAYRMVSASGQAPAVGSVAPNFTLNSARRRRWGLWRRILL